MNKLNLKKHGFLALASITLLLNACKKDKQSPADPVPTGTSGLYVLCETGYGKIGTITYYDLAKGVAEQDYFKNKNSIDLGINANDLKSYGGKMYCVITGTDKESKDSYLEVISIATGKSLKRIPFSNTTEGFLPRYVSFYKGKAYVSSYDGYITKVDTTNLSIDARLKVGGALEQLAAANGKLYVTNSAHFMYATDKVSSVSVVDLNTFTNIKDITVGYNPTKISANDAGDLYVITRGNYVDIDPSLDKLSSNTDSKITTPTMDVEYLYITGNRGFVIGPYGNEFLKTLNISTGVLGSEFVSDDTVIGLAYGVTVNPLNQDTYVADAASANSRVVCFDANGKKKFEFPSGKFPQSTVFKYNYK